MFLFSIKEIAKEGLKKLHPDACLDNIEGLGIITARKIHEYQDLNKKLSTILPKTKKNVKEERKREKSTRKKEEEEKERSLKLLRRKKKKKLKREKQGEELKKKLKKIGKNRNGKRHY